MWRYDRRNGGAYAGLDRVSALGDGRRMGDRSGRKRQNSAGAKLHGDELHDDLQCAGGGMPNLLLRSLRAGSDQSASQWSGNVQQRHPADEYDCRHGVCIGLQHVAARVPNKLRAPIAVSVIVRKTRLSSASGLSRARRWSRELARGLSRWRLCRPRSPQPRDEIPASRCARCAA